MGQSVTRIDLPISGSGGVSKAYVDNAIADINDVTTTLVAGDNISIIDNGTGGDHIYTISATAGGGGGLPSDFAINGGSNVQVDKNGNAYTISATDTVTTVKAGYRINITKNGNEYTVDAYGSAYPVFHDDSGSLGMYVGVYGQSGDPVRNNWYLIPGEGINFTSTFSSDTNLVYINSEGIGTSRVENNNRSLSTATFKLMSNSGSSTSTLINSDQVSYTGKLSLRHYDNFNLYFTASLEKNLKIQTGATVESIFAEMYIQVPNNSGFVCKHESASGYVSAPVTIGSGGILIDGKYYKCVSASIYSLGTNMQLTFYFPGYNTTIPNQADYNLDYDSSIQVAIPRSILDLT